MRLLASARTNSSSHWGKHSSQFWCLMARWKKIVGWTAIGIGALILFVVVAGVLVLKSGWFHHYLIGKIEQSASQSTGARVELQGFNFHLRTLTADIYGLTIHGKEPAGKPPL